jgi:hypothetical protein
MKQCPACGRQYSNDITVCDVDRQPLVSSTAPPTIQPLIPPAEQQRIVDREHLNLLSIFHFVVGGLSLLGIAFLVLHFAIMSTVFSNPGAWKTNAPMPLPPAQLMGLFVILYFILGAILAASCVLNVLSGLYLRSRKYRVFSIFVAALNCLHMPLGTILGVFTIIVLGRDSVRKLYDGFV